MKLVEILARELVEWPKNVYSFGCDSDGEIRAYNQDGGADASHNRHDFFPKTPVDCSDKASGYGSTCSPVLVTREMWQAEREKLEAYRFGLKQNIKPKKANAEGWIRHRGGKCPVSQSDFIEYRMRAGGIGSCCGQIELLNWSHSGSGADIMSYRFRKQGDEEIQIHQSVKDARNGCAEQQIDLSVSPLSWRDRIREIDRTVEALEEERVSLVQRLEDEGFKLIEQVNAKIAEAAQAHEDMSDWRNWRVGDLVECLHDSVGGTYRKGSVHEIEFIDGEKIGTVTDSVGDVGNSWTYAHFKFQSRPFA